MGGNWYDKSVPASAFFVTVRAGTAYLKI